MCLWCCALLHAVCGDGLRRFNETCDDRNDESGDGCSASCSQECGYICQNENLQYDSDTCETTCGDSIRVGDEDCDDGNSINSDGCSKLCTIEVGYIITSGSEPCSRSVLFQCASNSAPNNDYTQCPCENGFTLVGEVCQSDCHKGSTGKAGSCEDCVVGKYKDVTGSAQCNTCIDTNPISPVGSVSENACTSCGENQVSKEDKTGCDCARSYTNVTGICQADCAIGSTGIAGSCEDCAGGEYKASTGSAQCDSCSVDAPISPMGSVNVDACTSCRENSVPNADSTGCDCDASYTKVAETCQEDCAKGSMGTAGSCVQCVGGTYKDSIGSAGCDACDTDNHVSALGSVHADACTLCGTNQMPIEDKTDCGCDFSYTNVTGICQADCVIGSTGTAGSCVECVGGTYKASTGSAQCDSCGVDTPISPMGSVNVDACTSCGEISVSNADSTGCNCDALYTKVAETCQEDCAKGSTGTAGSCVQCVGGTYKDSIGSIACDACDTDHHVSPLGSVNANACALCGSNQVPNGDKTGCNCASLYTNVSGICQAGCARGYTGTSGICEECAGGKYKVSTGNAQCDICHANTPISPLGSVNAIACTTCGVNSVQKEDKTGCQCARWYTNVNGTCKADCVKGFTDIDGSCEKCAGGTYKASIGNVQCNTCNVTTPISPVGSVKISACTSCALNSVAKTDKTSCICRMGSVNYVFRLVMTGAEFDSKHDAFKLAISQAYDIDIDKIAIIYTMKITRSNVNDSQIIILGIEVSVTLTFCSSTYSQMVVPVSLVSDMLRRQGFPPIIDAWDGDNVVRTPVDENWPFLGMSEIVFYVVCGVISLILSCICFVVGISWPDISLITRYRPSTTLPGQEYPHDAMQTIDSSMYFAYPIDTQVDGVDKHSNIYIQH